MPREKLLLVALNDEQIVAAKAANGSKKQITHGLICGKYGQIFGTENQCRKYFEGWGVNFRRLFEPGEIREHIEIHDFASTFNLVERLLQANRPLEQQENAERLGYRSSDEVEEALGIASPSRRKS